MKLHLDFEVMWLIFKRSFQLRLRLAPLLTAFLLLASFWNGIGSAYAAPAIKQKRGELVHSMLKVEHGETLFSKPSATEIPLPAGDWRIRVIEDTYSTNKVKGLRIWLESVVNLRVEQFAVFEIYEAGSSNWREGNRCEFLISSPRGSAISGGCYGLSRTGFMGDPNSDIQKKVRGEWLQEGIQADRQSLALRGYADRRMGLVVYFEVRAIFSNDERRRIDLLLERHRNGSTLQSNELRLVDWYRNYGQLILDTVLADKASTSSQLLAESPNSIYYGNQQNKKQQRGDSIGLADERLETNQRGATEVNEMLGQEKLSEAGRLAEEKNLAEERRIAEERKRSEEKRLAEERKLAEAKRAEDERKKLEQAQLAEAKRIAEERRMAEERKLAEEKRLAEEKKLAEAKRADQERAAKEAMQREQKLAAELREMKEQLQALQKNAPKPSVAVVGSRRLALVIGNDGYQSVPKLINARADARAMAKQLEATGFKVTLQFDLTERAMKDALRTFRTSVEGGDEVVVFFAGHGVQLGTANYLLPVDIRGDSEEQVKDEAIPLQRILDDLSDRKARFSLAIVDACRDNPFKTTGRSIGGRGLAPAAAASGQMVIFSAGTGQQALDRLGDKDKDPNGLFTRIFLKEMAKPGVPIDRVVRTVRNEVVQMAKSVGHEQVPALYDQTLGDFFFVR